MSLIEIFGYINQNGFIIGIVLLICSCIKLPRYELNVWQLFIKSINKETISKLDGLEKNIESIEKCLQEHIKQDQYDEMATVRRNILNYASLIRRGIDLTEEQFNQALEDVDRYERFCDSHPDYENTKAVKSIQKLKEEYTVFLNKPNS